MPFIDEVVIKTIGGAGGNGCISFRREKYVPFGGPNGGNGGNGGSVYLKAVHDKSSLMDFKYQPKYEGERGEHGMGSDMYGACGKDLILHVPVGTLIYDNATGDLITDLKRSGDMYMVAKGGKGGRGNLTFKSSTNRAPKTATPGEKGEEKELKLELRLIADVGLLGMPNAGKSSFLRSVSRATPKVADYPFTTLIPHLGVVEHKDCGFVVADLPGLIEGASEGLGLGHQFLRHVTRNRVLLHFVEVTPEVEEIKNRFEIIRAELKDFDSALAERKEMLVFTKCDLLDTESLIAKKQELKEHGLDGFFISSKTLYGIDPLLDYISAHLAAENAIALQKENEAKAAEAAALEEASANADSLEPAL